LAVFFVGDAVHPQVDGGSVRGVDEQAVDDDGFLVRLEEAVRAEPDAAADGLVHVRKVPVRREDDDVSDGHETPALAEDGASDEKLDVLAVPIGVGVEPSEDRLDLGGLGVARDDGVPEFLDRSFSGLPLGLGEPEGVQDDLERRRAGSGYGFAVGEHVLVRPVEEDSEEVVVLDRVPPQDLEFRLPLGRIGEHDLGIGLYFEHVLPEPEVLPVLALVVDAQDRLPGADAQRRFLLALRIQLPGGGVGFLLEFVHFEEDDGEGKCVDRVSGLLDEEVGAGLAEVGYSSSDPGRKVGFVQERIAEVAAGELPFGVELLIDREDEVHDRRKFVGGILDGRGAQKNNLTVLDRMKKLPENVVDIFFFLLLPPLRRRSGGCELRR
jgi:hypothetical protein